MGDAPARLTFVVESGTDVRLVEGLAERFELTVLARRIRGGAEISHPARNGPPPTVGPAGRGRFAWFVRDQLASQRPARVLVQGYGAAAVAANLYGRRSGARTLMLVCSPIEAYYRCRRAARAPGKPYRPVELAGLLALARLNARVGRHYVVLSEHLSQVVRSHGTARPISVVPVYGVDSAVFAPPTEPRAALRRRLGLPPDSSVIVFSSRIAPEKDAETLLQAVVALRARGRSIHLLHRSGGFREFLVAAARHGLHPHVTATDAVHPDRLPPDYQASDLCVQASRAEGLGFSPLEALACETPVVAAAVGGLIETIIPGETGWTYPPGDAIALAGAIEAALADPAEARRRAARGRAMIRARYERGPAFDRLEALLR